MSNYTYIHTYISYTFMRVCRDSLILCYAPIGSSPALRLCSHSRYAPFFTRRSPLNRATYVHVHNFRLMSTHDSSLLPSPSNLMPMFSASTQTHTRIQTFICVHMFEEIIFALGFRHFPVLAHKSRHTQHTQSPPPSPRPPTPPTPPTPPPPSPPSKHYTTIIAIITVAPHRRRLTV